MSEEHLKDFEKKMEELGKEENAAKEAIEIKRETVAVEGENIRQLEGLVNKFDFTLDLYGRSSKKEILSFGDQTYQEFIAPLTDLSTPGLSAVHIRDESRAKYTQSKDHTVILIAVNTTGANATKGAEVMSRGNPVWFPNHEESIQQYKVIDDLEKNIGYIRTKLPGITPDISGDFDAFVNKYYAFKVDVAKYQDLIGARSMFFFKLIFDFSEKSYGISGPREDQIRKFVFGDSPSIPSAEPLIRDAKNVWKELSSQDLTGESVKLGKVTPAYIERLFRRLIGAMASLLELRAAYFS
jgi:hypothetical protein